MVRFIISKRKNRDYEIDNLHSNMVRFIIQKKRPHYHMILLFTFQYG